MELMETAVETRYTCTDRAALFEMLYEKAFPIVAEFVSRMNGSFEDTKDIFQDALVIYYEKTQDEDFSIHVSEQAYILGIAKHLWLRRFKTKSKQITLDAVESTITLPADHEISYNDNRLLQLLESTGRKCMNLLRAFYYEKLPLKKISRQLGYSSEHSATVQKYKCMEKVRDIIKQRSIAYEDFID